jgi:hypothetical protein
MLYDNESRMKVTFADGWQRMKLEKSLSAPGVAALKIGALSRFKSFTTSKTDSKQCEIPEIEEHFLNTTVYDVGTCIIRVRVIPSCNSLNNQDTR